MKLIPVDCSGSFKLVAEDVMDEMQLGSFISFVDGKSVVVIPDQPFGGDSLPKEVILKPE